MGYRGQFILYKNIAKYKVYVNPARWYAGLKYILQLYALLNLVHTSDGVQCKVLLDGVQ